MARAAARRRRSPRAWCRPPPAPTPRARCASRRRLLRHLDDQADARPRLAARRRAAGDEPRPRGPDGAHARGLRAAAGRDGRRPTWAVPAALLAARPHRRCRPIAESPGRSTACGLAVSPRAAASGARRPTSRTASSRDRARARRLGAAARRSRPPPDGSIGVGDDFLDVLTPSCSPITAASTAAASSTARRCASGSRRRAARRVSAERYARGAGRRRETTAAFAVLARRAPDLPRCVEPTVPCVAPLRGDGYDHAGSDDALISLTHPWDWTGFPVVALPAGVGARSGLPVGVSLIGRAGERLAPARHRHPAADRARRARAGLHRSRDAIPPNEGVTVRARAGIPSQRAEGSRP